MNITDTIEPKVDQLTADHLIGRTITIRITDVRLVAGEQPCEIRYEGDNGLPYRPGKSMRRVLVHCWGRDERQYAGRSLTLFRDEDVQFGGLKVGGIRISHMSHIAAPVIMALTAKKGSKKAYKVLPLVVEQPDAATAALPLLDSQGTLRRVSPAKWLEKMREVLGKLESADAVREWRAAMGPRIASVADADDIKAREADQLIANRLGEFADRDPGEEG
jgi:hypothetical protein